MGSTLDICIRKGSTFTKVLRWGAAPLISKAITGITKAAPVVVTAVGHGVPDGWCVAVTGVPVSSMHEINASAYPPKHSDFKKATVLTADTVEINSISSADYTTWTTGGFLVYYTPVDLAGYTARMHIRRTVSSSEIEVTLTTENGGITIDNTEKTISLLIASTETDDLEFTTGVYDLEMISGLGVVTSLVSGAVTVESEVTR